MSALFSRRHHVLALAISVLAAAGCSEYTRQSRAPAQLVIVRIETPAVEFVQLQGGTGVPGTIEAISGFGPGPLFSDINPPNSDRGRVVLRQILRDPGAPGAPPLQPTPLNDITVTEFEVRYRLPNGQSTPGVDVPYPVRGGLTVTISGNGTAQGEFELVRRVAKQEPPLGALRGSSVVVSTIADVTFFGRDQAGNHVSATGSVQVTFADF